MSCRLKLGYAHVIGPAAAFSRGHSGFVWLKDVAGLLWRRGAAKRSRYNGGSKGG